MGSFSLKNLIIKKIDSEGAITFADFMRMALYHPELGYYTKKRELATIPDYYTSCELHPVFGQTVANQINRIADLIKSEKFTVLEIGSGKGILAQDILRHLKRKNRILYDRLEFIFLERNKSLLSDIAKISEEHKSKILFVSTFEELDEKQIEGCVVSNELIDSFPVHRIIKSGGELKEIYVFFSGSELVEIHGEISKNEIKEYLKRYTAKLGEEFELEVNLEVSKWMRKISKILKKGFILTIDYGYPADKLYSENFSGGTLRCYKRHNVSTVPYKDIGEQDITADVNFSDLIYHGCLNGFELVDFVTQRDFLLRWGVLDAISEFAVGKEAFTPQVFSELEKIKNLLLPEGMGDIFKVLIQQKGVVDFAGGIIKDLKLET